MHMRRYSYSSRPHALRGGWWIALLVAGVLALLVGAAPAAAAPPPTLGLAALQAELAAQGSVDGYMRTALSGTTPQDIPVKILAVVDGFYWGKLIMFESTDQAIIDIGGIAAGMSGSPVYVTADGPDPMVGAVSYGDSFTLHGTGLATPIEYMTALQDQFGGAVGAAAPARAVRLDEPVVTSSGVVDRLVLDGEAAASAPAGTSVVRPLAEAMITGLPSGSAAYRRLAAKLEAGGLLVLSGEGAGAPAATPALEAGSPCGVSFSTGRYALTVLGTVTYADGDDVLLFGHPILGGYGGLQLGLGRIEGTLTGATVDAVWPSAMSPYKMMTPGDAKGVATQDRSAGVLARLGGSAPAFPVATHTSVDGGGPVDDVTDLGDWFAVVYWPDLLSWGTSPGITSYVAAAGLSHGLDSDPLVGSAATTTTVVVSDGTQDYTFTRDNLWDNVGDESGYGLAEAAVGDVTTIMANVLSDPFDVRHVRIESVDVVADFSTTRRHGAITDLSTARAVRWGENRIDVTYYHTGSAAPNTISAVLDVPEGTDLSGSVLALSAAMWEEYYGEYEGELDGASGGPLTLAQTKAIVEALPSNGDVIVAFIPDSSGEESDYSYGPDTAAETIVTSDWVVGGGVEKATAAVNAGGSRTMAYRDPIRVSGYARRTSSDEVAIYCREAGKPEPTEPTAVVPAVREDGMARFGAVLPGYRHNVLVTAEVGAQDETSLPGADQFLVKVRAGVRLAVARAGGRLALTARVSPADTDGSVEFQRLVRGRWVAAGSAKLARGVAAVKARTAGKVRARFTGGSMNAASSWVTAAVR
jgi:hypothetical protein